MILVTSLAVLALGAQERPAEELSVRDPRDGKSYPTVSIGSHRWMARNLDYETRDSFCYDDRRERCDDYGRLYRWEAALSACPPGWHLATEMEWQQLEIAVGLDPDYLENYGNRGTDEGARLKPGGDLGFDAQYGGWRRVEDGEYEALDRAAAYWTATESSLERAWHRDIDTGDDMIWRSAEEKAYGLSVRCVENYSHFVLTSHPFEAARCGRLFALGAHISSLRSSPMRTIGASKTRTSNTAPLARSLRDPRRQRERRL